MREIRFTRNTQNTRSFGNFSRGKSNVAAMLSHPCFWTHERVRRSSSSQITSAASIPFSESSVLFEIKILCILLFLHRNRNSQNSPKRMHSKILVSSSTFVWPVGGGRINEVPLWFILFNMRLPHLLAVFGHRQ